MIERYFKINNFRNIGVEKPEIFELNYLLSNEGSYGGLVTLIGENNSGKSNFLDALKAFQKRKFELNDKPFNIYHEIEQSISFYTQDKDTKQRIVVKLDKNGIKFDSSIKESLDEEEKPQELQKITIDFIDYIIGDTHRAETMRNSQRQRLYNQYITIARKVKNGLMISKDEFTQFKSRVNHQYIKPIINQKYRNEQLAQIFDDIEKLKTIKQNTSELEKYSKISQKVFNVDVLPNIIVYEDNKKISSSQLKLTLQNGQLVSNEFYLKLFRLLNKSDMQSLQKCYKEFYDRGQKNKGILVNYQRKLNNEINALAKKFNLIYAFEGNSKYGFKMDLESGNVFFMITENGESIDLDSQSTGFKWFFDFFFNVFANNQLKKGDIVILDEPATNLHVVGQIELRKQIKKFGMDNDITFVMATHSPFLIDTDYLDELRVISKDVNQHSTVCNKFTVNDENKIDVMMPIKTALTVNRHIIINPNENLIFVEGITDYNYLVAFKELLGIEGIRFMPIQGIKRGNLYKELLKITKTPVVLVDSDGAGKEIYAKYNSKEGIEIIKLDEVDASFTEIEDLFTKVDQEKFNILKKDYKASSGFKNIIVMKKEEVTKTTLNNFKKLIDHINV